MSVKRYSVEWNGEWRVDDDFAELDGNAHEVVLYADFAALQAKADRLAEALGLAECFCDHRYEGWVCEKCVALAEYRKGE